MTIFTDCFEENASANKEMPSEIKNTDPKNLINSEG
jgi:hypothetical protein